MHPTSVLAWLITVAGLLVKYVVITSVQGKRRFDLRVFRWAEDAAAFGGTPSSGEEDEVVERCQAVLRNDAESQTFFLAFSAAWVALGAGALAVAVVCGGYVLARFAHAYFLVRPRQPIRNRCFVVGQLALLAVVSDALRLAWTAAR